MAQASAEKLEHTGPDEKKKSGLSATKRAVGKYVIAAFAKKEKNRAICREHQIVRRAFNVREVKGTAAKERERDEYSSAEGQSESQSNRQSHPNEPSEN